MIKDLSVAISNIQIVLLIKYAITKLLYVIHRSLCMCDVCAYLQSC